MDEPESQPLAADEVHVWRAPLEAQAGEFPRLQALLSPEELARCDRLVREQDRRRFGLARGILRLLLARYSGTPARDIAFTYSPHGKPSLTHVPDLQFSVSHTEGMALYAFARGRRVGIDVERLREVQDRDQLVRRNFAPEEVAAYLALPEAARPLAFFQGWTRKEAFVKALGEGLSHPLSAFAVTLNPGAPRLLRTHSGSPHDWTLWDLTEDSVHVAALAAEGTGLRIRRHPWPDRPLP